MIHLPDWLRRHRWECVVGAALTGLALLADGMGWTRTGEWDALDWHTRHFSRVPASPEIVHVDIDDEALRRVGSWPWPRDLQAEIITSLHGLGARQILADIIWSEPRPPEVRWPGMEQLPPAASLPAILGELSAHNIVYPDQELADAIHAAGTVYLSLYAEGSTPLPPAGSLPARVRQTLLADFDADARTLVAALDVPASEIVPLLPQLKRSVAEELVDRYLLETPAADFTAVYTAFMSTPINVESADQADLRWAYGRALSGRALRDLLPDVPPALAGRLPRLDRVVPPLHVLTDGPVRAGLVSFRPDPDGRTRRVPLLMDWRGKLIEHLAFAAARDRMKIPLEALSFDARGHLRIAGDNHRSSSTVPLDADGELLVNWHVAPGGWTKSFDHRPVTLLLQFAELPRKRTELRRSRMVQMDALMAIMREPQGLADYRRLANRMLELERRSSAIPSPRQTDAAMGSVPAMDMNRELVAARNQLAREEHDLCDLIREEYAALNALPADAPERQDADARRITSAHALLTVHIDPLDEADRQLAAQRQTMSEQLRPLFADRICLLGYTATAVADMVSTPLGPMVPGVVVHANALNSILLGQFRRPAPHWVRLLLVLLAGCCATLAVITLHPRMSLLVLLSGAIVLLTFHAAVLFARFDRWVGIYTPGLLILAIWALGVLARYLTTDRQRRQFTQAVAQYVSPALARRMSEAHTPLELAPVRCEVSCFFSDLANFTALSERLGPEGTRQVLNPYLQSMSTALHQHEALINKFIGDGIFAFFNPPILPCPHHARAACEAALACLESADTLRRDHAGHALAAEFAALATRIGIATGPVFVGDYGSQTKMDYTCVGDTVNLAARLESANRYFGTHILVCPTTREMAGAMPNFRALGRLQVKGRQRVIDVHEVMPASEILKGSLTNFIECFEDGLICYQNRKWNQSVQRFQQCKRMRPSDAPSDLYLSLLRQAIESPPDYAWDGTIQLADK